MRHLKWTAAPIASLALVFLFVGIIWTGAAQLAIAAALFATAALIWRTTTGGWPLS
jgi:hypothetical protein